MDSMDPGLQVKLVDPGGPSGPHGLGGPVQIATDLGSSSFNFIHYKSATNYMNILYKSNNSYSILMLVCNA